MLLSWQNPSQLMLFQLQSVPFKEGVNLHNEGDANLQPDSYEVECA